MADTLSKKQRSQRMSRIRSKDSKAEKALRSLMHGMGFRYKLHEKSLPGTPDMVFPSRNAVVFMHGCFWHRHEDCRLARLPKSRVDFWREKLEANKQRDMKNRERLKELGWRVLTVWECELTKSNMEIVADRVKRFLQAAKGEENAKIG